MLAFVRQGAERHLLRKGKGDGSQAYLWIGHRRDDCRAAGMRSTSPFQPNPNTTPSRNHGIGPGSRKGGLRLLPQPTGADARRRTRPFHGPESEHTDFVLLQPNIPWEDFLHSPESDSKSRENLRDQVVLARMNGL